MVFETEVVSEGFFVGPNIVNCAAPFDGGRRIVYGTDNGVYVSNIPVQTHQPVKILTLSQVKQIDVLEEHHFLFVLSEDGLLEFSMAALDEHTPMAWQDRATRIGQDIRFFRAGYCFDQAHVTTAKMKRSDTVFRILLPFVEQGGTNKLRTSREFFLPTESSTIDYMGPRLLFIGCTEGFQVVNMDTFDTLGLLNPADENLSFVTSRNTTAKPIAVYRINAHFLLCYDVFAFYVNSDGSRAHTDFMVEWTGQPTGFALKYPYVLTVEPTFVEVRHVETGAIAQIIEGSNLRLLFADISTYSQVTVENVATQYARDQIVLASNERVMTIGLVGSTSLAGDDVQADDVL